LSGLRHDGGGATRIRAQRSSRTQSWTSWRGATSRITSPESCLSTVRRWRRVGG
jgi:hypothetical protein